MPRVQAALDGFSEVDPISMIVPIFEGIAFPVSFSIVEGDFDFDNDNYTIDSNGVVHVLIKPNNPIQNFVRYRITAEDDSCAWVEDYLQIFWSSVDFKPIVNRYVENPETGTFNVNSNGLEVAFIDNTVDMPFEAEYTLAGTYLNSDPDYVSSLFNIDFDGKITIQDIYNITEGVAYWLLVKVTDPITQSVYTADICLGPFNVGIPTYGGIILAEGCTSVTTTAIGYTPIFDCAVLQPRYPTFLNATELAYYETNCLDSGIDPPTFAILYEPLTTDFLEARSYTIDMSGLDSGINQPQTITFPQGESLVSFNLTGDIKTITAYRSETSFTVTFITTNNDIIITTNLNYREGLTDPLLSTFVLSVAGYASDFIYAVTSNQTLNFSDDHGLYIRNNSACYGRIGVVLGVDPDVYLVPNGGAFENSTDCLGD